MSDAGVNKVLSDAARLLASSLGELVPSEAQMHLLNAQRELLLAIAVIIEHNSGRTPRRPRARAAQPSPPAAAPSASS